MHAGESILWARTRMVPPRFFHESGMRREIRLFFHRKKDPSIFLLQLEKEKYMEKIASFQIDHLRLLPGLYVSRQDRQGDAVITTFDLRITAPNREPVMDMPALHTIEHLGATFLRNGPEKERVVYFGPMGCRTGCYLLLFGAVSAREAYPMVLAMCDFILGFEGPIPGARPEECGNYSEQNLNMAKYYIRRYRQELEQHRRFEYPA